MNALLTVPSLFPVSTCTALRWLNPTRIMSIRWTSSSQFSTAQTSNVNKFMLLFMCGPKASSKATEVMLIRFSQKCYIRPEPIHEKLFEKIESNQFWSTISIISKSHSIYIFFKHMWASIWGYNLEIRIRGEKYHITVSISTEERWN